MTPNQFRKLALSFEGTIEMPHFDRAAFKIINKRIFATLHEASKTANLMFSSANQYVYCHIGNEGIYPVNNKWGLKGATSFDLKKIDSQLMREALDVAYQEASNSGNKKQKRK